MSAMSGNNVRELCLVCLGTMSGMSGNYVWYVRELCLVCQGTMSGMSGNNVWYVREQCQGTMSGMSGNNVWYIAGNSVREQCLVCQ